MLAQLSLVASILHPVKLVEIVSDVGHIFIVNVGEFVFLGQLFVLYVTLMPLVRALHVIVPGQVLVPCVPTVVILLLPLSEYN